MRTNSWQVYVQSLIIHFCLIKSKLCMPTSESATSLIAENMILKINLLLIWNCYLLMFHRCLTIILPPQVLHFIYLLLAFVGLIISIWRQKRVITSKRYNSTNGAILKLTCFLFFREDFIWDFHPITKNILAKVPFVILSYRWTAEYGKNTLCKNKSKFLIDLILHGYLLLIFIHSSIIWQINHEMTCEF